VGDRTSCKQEGCVENSAASVEMLTDTPIRFQTNHDLLGITSFDSVTSQNVRFASFLALRMLLDKGRRTTMSDQTKNQETSIQQDFLVTTGKETKLDRLANEAAGRAAKTEQHYDQEHGIFTK
jgi:hypothetical protein